MLEAGKIGARAITTRWNIFISRCRSRCWFCSHCFAGPESKVWKWTFSLELVDLNPYSEGDGSQITIIHSPFREFRNLYLTIGEQEKKKKKKTRHIRFYFWKKSVGLLMFGSWWGEVTRASRTFFFFAPIFQNCWQPRRACTAFCIIMCKTVTQKIDTKKCTFVMITQICGKVFGVGGGGGFINMSMQDLGINGN